MGSPSMNLIPARLRDKSGDLHVEVSLDGGDTLTLELHKPEEHLRARIGAAILLGLRPEAFGDQDHAFGDNQAIRQFTSPVEMTEPTGPDMLAMINIGGVEVTTRLHAAADVRTGSTGRFTIDMSKAVFFDPESGKRI